MRRSVRLHNRPKKTHKTSRKMRGGYGPGAGPVGYPLKNGDVATWPGVIAANGGNTQGATMSNFYPLSKNGIAVGGVNIATPEVGQFGGRKVKKYAKKISNKHKRTNRKSRKGGKRSRKITRKNKQTKRKNRVLRGGFGPQELINFGRELQYRAKTAVSDFMGNQQPVDPSPLVQPISKDYKIIEPTPTNLPRSYNLAGSSVSPL